QLAVTDEDLNTLAARHTPRDLPVDNLRLRFTPEGLRASGSYPALFLSVPFETLWALEVVEGRVAARLASLRVAGIPAGKFRGLILKMAREALAGRPEATVSDDAVVVDPEAVLRREGLPLKLNLRAIHCGEGVAVIEAGV